MEYRSKPLVNKADQYTADIIRWIEQVSLGAVAPYAYGCTPFSRTINTDLPHGAALNREDMAIPLAWKIVAVALAKKATLYALGRVSCLANRAKKLFLFGI